MWEEGNSSTSAINILNAIWIITVNKILGTKDTNKIIKTSEISKLVKSKIIDITNAYPQKKYLKKWRDNHWLNLWIPMTD